MRRVSWIAWFAVSLASTAAGLPRASACTCGGAPIDRSDPEDGDQDVPVNAALLVMGAFPVDSLTLEDEDGQPVEFTLHAGPTPSCAGTSADLVPERPLRPDTTYVLEVQPLIPGFEEPRSVSFTTGAASLPDLAPERPTVSASVVLDVPPDGFSCGQGTVRVFVDVPDWEGVEVIARREDRVLLHWMLLAAEGSFKLEEAPDCLEFRRRAPTGRRSTPVVLCGDELVERSPSGVEGLSDAGGMTPRRHELDASAEGMTSPDAAPWPTTSSAASLTPSQGNGCSAGPDAPAKPWLALPLLVALAGLALRRRSVAPRA